MNVFAAGRSSMTKSRIAFIVWLLLWGWVLCSDIRRYVDLAAQKIPGYPNAEQFQVYILIPAAFVIANILLMVFLRRLPLLLRVIAFLIQFFGLPAYIFYSSGGV